MSFRPYFVLVLVVLICGIPLAAQSFEGCTGASDATTIQITCPVGSSISIDYGQGFSEIATLLNSLSLQGFSFTYSITASGTLPPGVTLSSSGLLSGTLTAPGTFNFTINITEDLQYMGQELFNETVPEPFSIIVTAGTSSGTTVDPSGLVFNLTQGAAPTAQSINVMNRNTQSENVSATATTVSGGNWLSVTSPGAIAPYATGTVSATVDASQLQPGTYSGAINISAGSQNTTVPVLVVVSSKQPKIQLSQGGLRFQAVTGGSATAPQTITVFNSGAGTLTFNAVASTLSGGNWLSINPSSGTATTTTGGSVTVSVNPAGLAPGDYYGQVKFSASGSTDAPQIASVVLNVFSAANSPGAFLQPTGLIFVGKAGGSDPAAKTLSLTNPSPIAIGFAGTAFASNPSGWITFSPSSGSVTSSQPVTVSVQPKLQGLGAGVYSGELVLTLAPSGTATTTNQSLHVQILLIVLPAGGASFADQAQAAGCTPTKLLPVFTQSGTGFTAAVGWPTAIEVTVVDDCGNPMVTGNVATTFSNGDSALALLSLRDGRWSATWQPVHPAGQVTVTSQAQQVQPPLKGTQTAGGALQTTLTVPVVPTGAVVSAASYAANQPLAPGSYVAVFGSNLSNGTNVSQKLPLDIQLGGTVALLGGEQVPLQFTSGGQINMIVPYDIPQDTTQQLIVQSGTSLSVPQPVVIAAAQPAVFTQSGGGSGPGIIAKADYTLITASNPATVGDYITIYCSGLGAVNPPLVAGTAASSTSFTPTVNTVTATVGGVQAQVIFAGLAPGYAGLYQVNAIVPPGAGTGDVPVVLFEAGRQSAPVTVNLK